MNFKMILCRKLFGKQITRVMKLSFLLLILGLLQLSANVFSQNTVVSLDIDRKYTIKELFQIIEDKTSYRFFYNDDLTDLDKVVSVSQQDVQVKDLLNFILDETTVSYKTLENDMIVVAPREILQQGITITGTVTDKIGVLSGVNVLVKGTLVGSVTDANGNYSITVPGEDAVLVFSFVGYEVQEYVVGSQRHIDVILAESLTSLEEIVVVGYGTQKKTSVTAAVSTLKGNEIVSVPVSNMSGSLTGRMSGVIVRQGSGEPGKDGSSIYIRGASTTGSTAPLVIVDNIPRSFNSLNPNDVESITILKDAAAVAPYGVAGANGVILVTTKKGKKGTPTVSYHGYVGFQNPTVLPEVVDALGFIELKNVAAKNTGVTEPYSDEIIQKFIDGSNPDLYANSNVWKENLDRNTIRTQHSINLSGGNDLFTYYTSFGYYHQDGLWSTNYSDRFNISLGLDAQLSKYTKIALNVKVTEDRSMYPGIEGDDVRGITRIFELLKYDFPVKPNKFSNGLYASYSGPNIYESGYLKFKRREIFSQLSIMQDLPFVPGLSLKGTIAYDPTNILNKLWSLPPVYWSITDATTTPYTYKPSVLGRTKPYLSESMQDNYRITSQVGLEYAKDINENHIKALALFEAIGYNYSGLGAARLNYNLLVDELSMGSSNQTDGSNSGMSSKTRQIGGVFRVNYDYNSTYYLEVSGRYDGSYYFAKGKKFGFFPAVSLGYRLSEENFMKNIQWITNLKIRGSYGEVGALAGSPFQYLNTYGVSGMAAILGNSVQQGTYERQEANPNITWERARKTNIGLDVNLWNHLFTLEADYFYEKRSNMLVNPNVIVPSEYGIGLSQVNEAEMDNRGVDLTVGTNFRISKDLRMAFIGNFTYAKSKLLKVFETPVTYNNPNRRVTGRPLGTQFGYESLGYFQLEDFDDNGDLKPGIVAQPWGKVNPGDIRYKDTNGDGKINEEDNKVIGKSQIPTHLFGFSGNIEYKYFALDFLFQGAIGASNYKQRDAAWLFDNGMGALVENLDYWTPENRNALNPRPTPAPTTNNTQRSSHWMRSLDYFRLKSATLTFTVPQAFTQKLRIDNINIYLSGENLLTFTKFTNYDPEITEEMGRGYPILKVISAGINITF